MKKIKNNKGFALAEILAVTLVLMIIFTVLYSNFMPLSGEYARAESYKDISSQYELHYFRKLFKNSTLESENYKVLINSETNECPTSSDENMCNSLKNELNPTLILTKYNISELKNELKQDINKLSDLRNYILSLPDYIDKNGEDEVYRLIIKTSSGYATSQLDYKTTKIMPNAPVLTSNMIPVYYDATTETWKKADSSNDNSNWYDYDNKIWANAITVSEANRNTYLNAEVGTEIPMSDINTMWVWIPRYKYTYLNSSTPQGIQIKFESGTNSTGTIKCTDNVKESGAASQTCTDSINGSLVAGTSTYTHPAFTFGDKELTGIWVGKFENSATTIPTKESTADSTIIIKPDVVSLRYKAVSYQFKDIRQMEQANNIYGFPQSSSTTFNWNGELTGDTNDLDIHMMKNIEWGAAVYLSHSDYGINKEININNSSGYYTGRSGGNVGGKTPISGTYPDKQFTQLYNNYGFYTYDGYLLNYDTNTKSTTKDMSKIASTTGNIYGIYDMSGGAYEHTMSNMVDQSNKFQVIKAENWSTTTYPLAKYYDSYTYDSSYRSYERGKLGDATKEMAPSSLQTWYEDDAVFLTSKYSWFLRGSGSTYRSNAGSFDFHYSEGCYFSYVSSRAVLDVLN